MPDQDFTIEDIAALECENKLLRARISRLESENAHLGALAEIHQNVQRQITRMESMNARLDRLLGKDDCDCGGAQHAR